MKHAELGASGAHRWRNCPGSIRLSRGQPDSTSVYAAEGTVAHEQGELMLAGQPFYANSAIVEQDGYPITVTAEMMEAVQVYVDFVSSQAKGNTLLLEQQFDLGPLNPPGPMYGTADGVVWEEATRHLYIDDYKHGAGVAVDAVDNDQGLIYMLGASVKFILDGNPHPELLTFTIIQPRAHHDDGPVRSWTLTWDELCALKPALFEDAAATLEPDAPLNAGDWCRFCKAKAICPAQKAQVQSLAVEAFDAEPTFPAPEGLSLTDLAEVLAKGPRVTDWLKTVQAYALNMAQRGEAIPGFKLVEKRSNRRWQDEEKALTYLRGRKLKQDERYNRKVISPAQAEKILKGMTGRDLPDRLWEKPEGGVALAPLSDKRPEKSPGVHEEFDTETTSKIGEAK